MQVLYFDFLEFRSQEHILPPLELFLVVVVLVMVEGEG